MTLQLLIIFLFGAVAIWLTGEMTDPGPKRAAVAIFCFFGWIFAYLATTKLAKFMDSRQAGPETPEDR